MEPSLATAAGRASRGYVYEPPGCDEACLPGGRFRPECAPVFETLAESDVGRLAARLQQRVNADGVSFSSANGDSEFAVDPCPRIIEPAEWALLERGLAQRARALNEFARDAYGARKIVEAGIVPERVVDTADHFEPELAGDDLGPCSAGVIGFDVVRGADGVLRVLEDNARTPSGFCYAIALREALDAELEIEPPPRRDPAMTLDYLRSLLRAREDEVGRGRTALLTDGPANSAWWEHRMVAERLGIALVTPQELRVRGDRLFMTGDQDEEIAVVYRRTDEDRLADEHGDPTWLAESLLGPVRAGNLAVVNAPGTGVADDKLAHAYVERMIGFYLDEEPELESVPSFDLSRPSARTEVLGRLEEMVIKPRSGMGGEGVVIYSLAGHAERAGAERAVRERPEDVIAQEAVWLSTHPTACGGGLEPRHVDLRAYVIGNELAPAPLTRVALRRGEMVVNSSQDGGAKDTWVLA